MIKVGAITIGQSPRTDVTQDILPLLGDQVELLQAGGLDGLTREEIEAFQPGPDDYVLISRRKLRRLCRALYPPQTAKLH